jgi:hypothetical protein
MLLLLQLLVVSAAVTVIALVFFLFYDLLDGVVTKPLLVLVLELVLMFNALLLLYHDVLLLQLLLLLMLGSLYKDLLDVALDLTGEQVSQPEVQAVFDGELPRQVVGVVALEDLDVFVLAVAYVDGYRQELLLLVVVMLMVLFVMLVRSVPGFASDIVFFLVDILCIANATACKEDWIEEDFLMGFESEDIMLLLLTAVRHKTALVL